MKKIILTSLFILSYSFSNEISGVTYFEYSEDVFSISRTYFTYKKTISDELSFTMQTDIGKVGDDDRSTVYLKKAQLNWKLNKDIKLSMGLIGMNMFNVQEKTWGNRFVAKSAIDQAGWSSSADLGIGIFKSFGKAQISLLMTNGEGFKHMDVDDESKLSLQIAYGEKDLSKNDGFNVGLVHSILKGNAVAAGDGEDAWSPCTGDGAPVAGCTEGGGYWLETVEIPETDTNVKGIFGGWSSEDIVIGAEYNTMDVSSAYENPTNNHDISSKLISAYINYDINANLYAFIRQDNIDYDTDSNTDEEQETTIAGIVWQPTKGIDICPNITKVVCDNCVDETDDVFSVNFQFKF